MANDTAATPQLETPDTATQLAKGAATEPVKNPDGLLEKNKELLGKVVDLNAKVKEFEAYKAQVEAEKAADEQKKLEKKGEWETLRGNMEKSHAEALEAQNSRYAALFESASRSELAVEIAKHDILEGTAERLAKLLLLDEIKPVDENGKVVWRKIATDEEVQLSTYIPSIADAYGEYFKGDTNPGSNAPGNKRPVSTSQNRSQMSTAEKSAFVAKHGKEAFLKLPN